MPPIDWTRLRPGASPLDEDYALPRDPPPPDDNHHRPDYVELLHSHALVERHVAEEAGLAYREHRVPVSFLTPNPRDW
jgi:hypothetical protein